MNKEKIDTLYKIIGCTNTDIARCIDCVQSSISRVRSGSRDYAPTSRPVINFAEGVYIFADKNNNLQALCELCGCDNTDRNTLTSAIISYMFDGDSESASTKTAEKRSKRRQKSIVFGKRLNAVMNLLELSSVRLARKINTDASNISRFRSGVRSPSLPISTLLGKELLSQVIQNNRLNELAKMTEISAEILSDIKGGLPVFMEWLYSADNNSEVSSIDALLDNLDAFTANPAFSNKEDMPEPKSLVTDDVLHSDKKVYWGTEGMREAVCRFLANAAEIGGELYLYSDENIDWMVGDQGFFNKWFALMVNCIKKGVKIKIIHNIERGTSEMISAIQSWMPLYMSGLIESFVCRKTGDERFSHTLFIHHGKECISASHVKGSEATGRYEYFTDEKTLNVLFEEYGRLLKQSKPLIRVYFEDYITNEDIETENIRALLSSLSLATMPKELLNSILYKNGVEESEKKKIIAFYEKQKKMYDTSIDAGTVREFVVVHSDEDLFAGKVRINLPLSLCSKELYYTPDDYAEHTKNIITIHENNANYHFYSLPETPFDNLQIISTDGFIAVIRAQKPYATFVFHEPLMIHGFISYFNVLKTKLNCDRNELRQMLKRFI